MSQASPRQAERKGKSVEAILSGMSSAVKVAIEITNVSTYTLEKPSFVMQQGVMEYAPHTEIAPGENRSCGFRKHGLGPLGCLGVLRYSLKGTEKCLDIFFSCPYVCAFYDITMAIQLENTGNNYVGASQKILQEIDKSRHTPEDFDKKKAGDSAATVINKALNLTVTATMKNEYESIMRVHLSSA